MKGKKKSKAKEREPRVGVLWPFGAATLLAVVAFFLRDFPGVRYGLVGSYVWLAAFGITVVVGLFYYAQFILPLSWQDGWYESLRLNVGYNFATLLALAKFRLRGSKAPAATPTVQAELSPGFNEHRAGMVESHHAYALARGTEFTRAVGPGYVSLEPGEVVTQVVDLRPHVRRLPVKALTRDGIPVETAVSVVFQVNPPGGTQDPDVPYPYDQGAIFQINYLADFSTGEESLPWTERIGRQAVSATIAEIARHTLDELYVPDASRAPPMEKVRERVKKQMTKTFAKHGVQVISASVGQLKLPEEINDQRIQNWQAEWEKRIQIELATGSAEAMRRITLARARAQIEIINNIVQSVTRLHAAGNDELSDVIAMRLLDTMSEIAGDDKVQALVPQHVFASMQRMVKLLE